MLLLLLSHFSRVRFCVIPYTAAHQVPPSLGFSRQEHWSGLPFPSPVHESEKWKWSHSVVSDSVLPHRWQPTRLPCPWDSPDKNTGVGCHFLLQSMKVKSECEVAQSRLTLSNLQLSRLLRPWDFPGKDNGVGCYCLLRRVVRKALRAKMTRFSYWIVFLGCPMENGLKRPRF